VYKLQFFYIHNNR